MHTYISTTIGFRNKGSLSFNDFYGLNGRKECPYSWGSPLSIHGLAVHPRILYGLRQSTLIQWSASRRLILGGAYGNGYCQLAAAAAARECECDYRVCCPLKERRRGRRIACMVWESDGCNSSNDGSVEEMLSLMTDVVEKRSRERNGRLAAKSTKKTDDQRCCVCQKEKKVGVDDHSRREAKHVDSGSWKRKSKGEITIRAGEEGRRSGREETSRDDNRVVRKDGSSSSYFSVSSNGFESSMDEGIRVKQGNIAGESSSWYKNYSRSERMGSCNEEVKRIQEHRDGRHNLESSKERITARVSTQQDDRLRSDVVESDVEWGSSKGSMKFAEISDSQESDICRASLRENRSEMRMEKSEENKDDRHHAGSLSMRIAARESTRRDHRLGLDAMEGNTKLGSMKELEKFNETSQWRESDIQRASSSENCSKIRMEDSEDISTSSPNFVCEIRKQFSEEDQRVGVQKESRRESQQLNKISKSREDDIDNISNSQEQINTRTQYREEDTSSHINLIDEERMQHRRKGQRVTGQTESRKKSQSHAEVSEIHDIDIERSSRSQTVFKARVSDREDNSTLVLNSVQEAREQSSQRDQQAVRQIQSQKESQTVHESESHFSDAERLSSSQMVSETRINNQEESLTSAVSLVQEDRRKQYPTDEQVIRQRGSRKQSYAKTSEVHGSNIERASSSSQMLLKTRTEDQAESSTSGLYSVQGAKRHQMGVRIEDNRNSQVMVVPPQSQSVYRGSGQGAFNENTIDTSHSPSTHHEGKTPASLHELDELDDRTGKKGIHYDALGSADRMERSTAEFVGEFVDNLQREALTSHESSLIPKHASEIQKDSRRFSTGSGVKGPSDEMWDVAGPSSQEPFGAEAPEKGSPTAVSESTLPTSAGHTVVKRSGRSLWSYIADVVRKSWGARSESHSTPVKSGVQSSSEESLYSDAYFSGREPDNDVDENVRKGRKGLSKELAKDFMGQPSERTNPTQIHEPSDMTSSQNERTVIQADTRTSTGTLQRHPATRGASSVSGEGDGEIEIEKVNEHIPSSAVTTDSSLPLVARPSASTGSSKAFTDKGKILEIGIVEEGPMREGITEASVTEGMDREIKQRKLQRNKQVLRERFDEWEEAFKLEHEQRKTDEMFMREALREAKKAADTWEVPVGAVLVQNGKIISRGCNLVEELRDSTAHAEMICIREASNLLRTWRLSETTLYVTLEPCPMCAGAILQARIDTVVWGAPNKLLGADGSWISLFPGGGEEGRDGPIHPFHPKITIRRGILATDCADVMQQFFQLRRKKNKKPESPPSCLPVSNLPSKFFSKVHDAFGMMFCL